MHEQPPAAPSADRVTGSLDGQACRAPAERLDSEVTPDSIGAGSSPDDGETGQEFEAEVFGESRFFRLEAELLYDWRWRELRLEALLVYLCHLKGYTGRLQYSGMGMKGVRERTGMRPRQVERATRELVDAGLILQLPVMDPRAPKTCIAALDQPYQKVLNPSAEASEHDGHHYKKLEAHAVEMAFVPWSLVDASPDMGEPTIADITSSHALRLLLWLYLVSREDGYVHKTAICVRTVETEVGQDKLEFKADEREMQKLGLEPGYQLCTDELLGAGLVEVGPEGKDGWYPLVLLHKRQEQPRGSERAA